jgi:hypothetical protein
MVETHPQQPHPRTRKSRGAYSSRDRQVFETGGEGMTHLMTEEEYAQYLEDKKELQEYHHLKEKLPERIRYYFNRVRDHVESNNIDLSYPVGFSILTGCKQEQPRESYCDMCPVGWLFDDCPLGNYKNYSK